MGLYAQKMIGLRFGTRFTLFHCEHDEKLDESLPTSTSLCNRPEVAWQYQQPLSELAGHRGKRAARRYS